MVAVGIKLQADAMAVEIEPRQGFGDAFGCRLIGGDRRLQSDLTQRLARLRAARKRASLADGSDKRLIETDPPRSFDEAPQPFAGRQHQIVMRGLDAAPDPVLNGRGIRRVADGEHRALQNLGALLHSASGQTALPRAPRGSRYGNRIACQP